MQPGRPASMCLSILLLCCAATHSQTPALQRPSGLAYDTSGNLYIVDTYRNQVLEATVGGALLVVAGTGTQGFAGDNGPATAAQLNAPQGIALGSDGTLYVADTANHRVRAITAGQITTIAGTGTAGYSGDGGPANAATLRSPTALTQDPTGALLLCDTANHRVRRIANGIITTVAGNGTQGFSGDGGPATSAQLDTPAGIAAFAAGAFYITDSHNSRIRSVGLNGIIQTIAGTGSPGYAGDSGPATQAKLATPGGLVLTSAGLALADARNQRIRLIDSSGTITTLAGSGTQGTSTDGDPTLKAAIDTPAGLALSPYSWIAFADSANRTVRMVAEGQLYLPAALAPARASTISTTPTPTQIYGTASLSLNVSGAAGTPRGTVQLLDGTTLVASGVLAGGVARLPLSTLTGGTHTLTAAYLGDGLNPSVSAPTNITISPAASVTTQTTPAQSTYSGLPATLTAQVSTTTLGTPTGTVQFLDGSTVVASGQLAGGSATGVYLAPSSGTHAIQATYGGDSNFLPSSSAVSNFVVQAMPDFILTAATTSQTVQGGSIAIYPITVASQPGPFSGAVTMSAAGLPSGATVSFTPAQVIPGAGTTTTQMSITTPVKTADVPVCPPSIQIAVVLLTMSMAKLRRRVLRVNLALGLCVALLTLSALGCGSRSITSATSTPSSYAITVTGTSTNLAGAVVVHTTVVQLTVQ